MLENYAKLCHERVTTAVKDTALNIPPRTKRQMVDGRMERGKECRKVETRIQKEIYSEDIFNSIEF